MGLQASERVASFRGACADILATARTSRQGAVNPQQGSRRSGPRDPVALAAANSANSAASIARRSGTAGWAGSNMAVSLASDCRRGDPRRIASP